MKESFVEDRAPGFDVSIGVGDSERHDGPFLNRCTVPLVVRRVGDQDQTPEFYPLIEGLSTVTEMIKKLRRSPKLTENKRRGKPRVFIGSSKESQEMASALLSVLQGYGVVEPHLWKYAFDAPQFTLEALELEVRKSDFAVFVCAADDQIVMRGVSKFVPRDNILFELGLFTGGLGRLRCFMVIPDGTDVALPSDLLGITLLRASEVCDGRYEDAVDAAARGIRKAVESVGLRQP
jgi:predicted nucleotide-binding protein